MVCIYCNSKTKVSNSRSTQQATWRRRECLTCGSIFTSYEKPDYAAALRVQSSSLQPFSRDKLFVSLNDALSHKKTALRDAGALSDTIIAQLAREHQNGLLTVHQIIACSQAVLQRYDAVAASVYAAKHAMVK